MSSFKDLTVGKEEIWRDIQGYEGLYQVSNLGRVKSLERVCPKKNGGSYYHKEKILCQGTRSRKGKGSLGYKQVDLSKDSKRRTMAVHRLVAMAFIPNPKNLPMINHKDENPRNNEADNLEWCDGSYNQAYGTLPERRKYMCTKPIVMCDRNGKELRTFLSVSEAARAMNCSNGLGNIVNCIKNKRRTAYGYIWKYKE